MDGISRDQGDVIFRNASEFLAFFRVQLAHADAADAIELMRRLNVPTAISPPVLYAVLQAAAHLSEFLVVVDEDLEFHSSTYERRLRVVLTAIMISDDENLSLRIEKYVRVLVSLRASGVGDDDIVRELFLRGGISGVSLKPARQTPSPIA
jgi:hypothetical protein